MPNSSISPPDEGNMEQLVTEAGATIQAVSHIDSSEWEALEETYGRGGLRYYEDSASYYMFARK
jgi:hypothetical protein